MKNLPDVAEAKEMISELFVIGDDEANRYRTSKYDYNYEVQGPASLSDCLIELEGTYTSRFGKTDIVLSNVESNYRITFSNATIFGKDLSDESKNCRLVIDEKLYVVAIATDQDVYVAVTCIRYEDKWMFDQVKSLYGKACAIKNFVRLFKDRPQNREYIKQQLRGRKYKRYDPVKNVSFSSRKEQALKYAMTRENITPEAQSVMEEMLKETGISRRKTEQRMGYLSRIIPDYVERISVTEEHLRKLFNERIYKHEQVKEQLMDVIISNERAKRRGYNILLVGGPGLGKTLIMETIAEALNIPSENIPLNGMTASFVLDGLDPGYESADAGRLVKAFAAHGTSEMVICLDEIDKMNRDTKEGDPMNSLYRVLLGEHVDAFLGCGISTENTVFIATCNSIDRIPDPIKNRFNAIIWLEDYSVEDKVVLARDYLIPALERKYQLTDNSIKISDEVLRYIISEYCEDSGARELQHNLEKIVQRRIRINSDGSFYTITIECVKDILGSSVEVTPTLFFNRNEDEYSEIIANEIRTHLDKLKEASYHTREDSADGKNRERLKYLLACRNEKHKLDCLFDPKEFAEKLHSNLFGLDDVIEEATLFYHTAFMQGKLFSTNLALCGGYGIGKTSITKNIADAMGYNFVKISLNGVNDAKELRGFSSTYTGSEPGRIIKGVLKAGSLKTVFQLDEIDKLKPEIAVVLVDLLDREFTDSFLDVPVNFDESIFIATANDWSNVPPVIRDRFIVINVDGYSREEKAEIVSEYILPKMEKGYAANSVSISIDNSARSYLLETYCPSFGVRDAERALQKIVSSKLLAQAGSVENTNIFIKKEDVRKYLGEEPIPRGNFPQDGNQAGIAKALAVSNGNIGSTFAIETVLVNGNDGIELTGLPKESASDSAKIAVTCIRKMYPGLLDNRFVHIHFGEGSVHKDGPSAGVALFMSIYSAAIGRPIMMEKPYDISYTGELSLTGGIFAVGGVVEKIQAAYDSGCKLIFIPALNYEHMDRRRLEQFDCEIVPVSHISEVINRVFP